MLAVSGAVKLHSPFLLRQRARDNKDGLTEMAWIEWVAMKWLHLWPSQLDSLEGVGVGLETKHEQVRLRAHPQCCVRSVVAETHIELDTLDPFWELNFSLNHANIVLLKEVLHGV